MSNSKSEISDDEIDVLELIKVIWDNKKIITVITALAAFFSVIYSLAQPNIYRGDALLAPAEEKSGGMAGLASQFGGVASLAGIPLPDESADKSDLGLEVLKSRKFAREFVERHKILPQLMAVGYWNPNTRELILDSSKYDHKTKKWLDKEGPPTNEEIFKTYRKNLILEEDKDSKFIRIGFKHKSPDIAAQWTGLVIKDLNNTLRMKDIQEAESSIAYLRQQIEQTPLTELRKLFFNLIEAKTETMMLANVREEYVFKTIDPAVVPEQKSEPKRALICILGTFFGGFSGLIYIIFRHYIRN